MRRVLVIGAALGAFGCNAAEEEPPAEENAPPTCAEGEWRLKGSLNGVPVDEAHAITPPHRLVNVEGGSRGSLELEGVDGYLHVTFPDRLTPSGSVPASVEIRVSVPSVTWLDNCAQSPTADPSTLALDEDSGGGTFTARSLQSMDAGGGCGASIEGELEGCFRFP